ncbi:site-specific integrase [Maribacter sp. PR1]|uniref:Site-specific integrase n=1 Tax=Maribacter cobaltidurans TaxID=1178778 RepID=A0ABU7ITE8_9FLAO|nr:MULTISPECIES: site-specific integrase [Maribacter]MDC6388781.1 site-specific integrase [Maribacter sp. PR1]MEE1976169.1 site-specific integrase [Maribacter cobaltidurans]
MSMISLLLQNEYEKAYVFRMKVNFSEPKIYTGGVDVSKWSTLSRKEQNDALDKPWYVYYSFRNPETGKMIRQGQIKGGANKFKTKKERYQFLAILRNNLHQLLAMGFNPYSDNSELIHKIEGEPNHKKEHSETKKRKPKSERAKSIISKNSKPKIQKPVDNGMEIHKAMEFGLQIKKNTLSANSYPKFKNHITRFQKWLRSERPDLKGIREIDKKIIVAYLNSMLSTSSSRNRNNGRTCLSSLFTTLENNEIIEENFIKKINVLKTKPKRNKTYTPEQLERLEKYMKENDPLLLLYVYFVSYNMLRPVEVCRLRVSDIDKADKKLYIRAKNKPVKIKIIPDILLSKLPDLSVMQPDHFLFTPYGFGEPWNLKEVDRRNYFSRRFKKIKDIFKLGDEYGLYSYRHTNIGMMYREMSKSMSPMEVKSKLMLITGHTTLIALEKYLRDIDAELPMDYSGYLDPDYYKNLTDKS